jgi:glycosyltransferase involved in cell wall biosynthesis
MDITGQAYLTWNNAFFDNRLTAEAAAFAEARKYDYYYLNSSPNGGLTVPGFFNLGASVSTYSTNNSETHYRTRSFFGNATNANGFTRKLKDLAEPLGDRIIFTGFVPYNKMPDYLSIADAAVIPSVWDDPFPTTVLEAQAMGLPIITTRHGGIPEEVTEENAILLDTDDHFIDHLVDAILDLYQHPEKRKQMSQASLKRSKLFDKEIYAQNFFAALETIINNRP